MSILDGSIYTLRPYQEEAVQSIFDYFVRCPWGNPIVALPTGTGKSLVIAEFLKRALAWYSQTRALVITHVKELIQQDFAELVSLWPTAPAGIYSAGLGRRDTMLPITFCGIGSIVNKLEHFGRVDLILIDECHLINDKESTMYAKVIAILRAANPYLKVIGFTATAFRLGMGLLTEGKIFDDICIDYCTLDKFNGLVDDGYLSQLIPKRTDAELSVEGVHTSGGEYIQAELQAAVDKEAITLACLREAVELSRGRRHYLCFCAGTQHADHSAAILDSLGIPALPVHSKLETHDRRFTPHRGESPRDMHLRIFREGRVGCITGMNIFTTGFNFRPIDCIIVMRPTMSPGLWVQMLGRGTRPSPETYKRDCLVLDFAANTRRLGPINDPVIPQRKGKKKTGLVPYKTCPVCNTYNHCRVRFCISCQYEFPENFKAAAGAATEELIRREPKVKEPKPEKPPPELRVWNVLRVEYAEHFSRDPAKPKSLRASYYCQDNRVFNEWLCFEHTGFAKRKAHSHWRLMAGPDSTPPETVNEALESLDALKQPTQIRVLMQDKFPEVVGYDFATVDHLAPAPPVDDDDIPF